LFHPRFIQRMQSPRDSTGRIRFVTITPAIHEEKLMKFALCALTAAVFATAAGSACAAPGSTEKLPSGVVVEHVSPGTGPQPVATDVVRVNYRGTLANGTEFDSSAKHGGPAEFPLNRVIPCWTQVPPSA
jgi:FKBP-type peptidyl-prolyl cis-trans isomerase